ncbi:hypothetical protein HOY80DRAFT_1024426 [Tuber brumale]|nr:hypothetical protein HOY80DRAFT_1024426 [Tuber brumale]
MALMALPVMAGLRHARLPHRNPLPSSATVNKKLAAHNHERGQILFTPRDLRSGSGIYFKHTYTRDFTGRGNAYYTTADHKKKHEKGNEEQNENEAHATRSASQTITEVANLPLVRVSYKTHIFTTATRTILTQSFHHPGNAPIDEATYSFPLYAGCSVVSFVCHVGPSKVITGVVQPKVFAKATYEKAKSHGHTSGLLEQFTPEIFKTSLGNIPAGVTVRVEITYLTELKHDTKVDGIRFTVPTSIAPRYGAPPEGLFGDKYETRAEKGVSFSIDITMGERIRTIESPSHGVSVQLGTHKATTRSGPNLANQYDDKKALVTLSQRSMHLSGDFVLLVTTVTPMFLYTPKALLEVHPTIPGQQALMVTLVPRFTFPKSTRSQEREIIFIVDRSGSMEPMIAPLKSAVSVFIKSLPVGCKFNICSFGSDHSFLWEKSQDYSTVTVRAALKLVDSFNAEMGGTELLKPIQETVKRRQEDMNTEVIVLTDGEIWGEDQVLGFIKQATEDSKGKLRFFSIGLGSEVSHSLVEGIARIGGGYSQIIADGSDEQDTGGWEGKVVKMLKAALTEHIDHCSIEVIGEGSHVEDSEEEEESTHPSAVAPGTSNVGESTTAPQAPKKLLLFNPDEDLDVTPGTPPSDDELPVRRPAVTADPGLSDNRFSHLKRLKYPEILHAPHQIPPLYSQQSIPITRLAEPGLTIHQLAARMALRDLEDGSSWLHSGKHGINPNDDTFQEYVEREGESLSIKWSLASKWASFVAVEDEFLEKEAAEKAAAKTNAMKSQCEEGNSSSDGDDDYTFPDSGSNTETLEAVSIKTPVTDRPEDAFGALSLGGQPSASIVALALGRAPRKIPGAFSVMHTGHDSMSRLMQPRNEIADRNWDQICSPHSTHLNSVQTMSTGKLDGFSGSGGFFSPQYNNRYSETESNCIATDTGSGNRTSKNRINCGIEHLPPGKGGVYNSITTLPGRIIEGIAEGTSVGIAEGAVEKTVEETVEETVEGAVGETLVEVTRSKSSSFGRIIRKLARKLARKPSSPKSSYKGKWNREPTPVSDEVSPPTSPNPSRNDTPHQRVVRIIRLQEFMGSFPVTEEMAQLIGLELLGVEKLTKELFPDKATDKSKALAMTSLVVAYLELEMRGHEDTWQMVVEKAREFLEEGCERVEALKEKAEGIIEEKVLKDYGDGLGFLDGGGREEYRMPLSDLYGMKYFLFAISIRCVTSHDPIHYVSSHPNRA